MDIKRIEYDEIYVIEGVAKGSAAPFGNGFSCRFMELAQLSKADWQKVANLQGRFAVSYLRLRYRASHTRILLVEFDAKVVSVLWVVPFQQIQRNYPFVSSGSAIIACVTSPEHRGKGLYPAGLRFIATSGHSQNYFVWAHKDNLASLRGIEKAGGKIWGEFTRVRWLMGLRSTVTVSVR